MEQNQAFFPKRMVFLAVAALFMSALAMPALTAASDQFEDDDVWTDGNTIAIGAPAAQLHDFHDEGDQDWVRFEVMFAGNYEIFTENLAARSDTMLYLYGPWPGNTSGPGPLIASSDDDGGGGASWIYTALEPGVYFALVTQYDGSVFGEDTEYELRVEPPLCCMASLSGYVFDQQNGLPIPHATVRVNTDSWISAETDQDGHYTIYLVGHGGFPMRAEKTNYNTWIGSSTLIRTGYDSYQPPIVMVPKSATGTLAGHVYDGSTALAGVRTIISGTQALTAADGSYWIRLAASNNHSVAVLQDGYQDYFAAGITVIAGATTIHDVYLAPADTDHDGLSDREENAIGTDPANPDTDADGISDGDEVNGFGTSPLNWDSDGDYLPDLYEVTNMAADMPLDPLNALDGAMDFESSGFEDGNPNYQEYWNGSDLWAKDPVPDPFFPDTPGCYYWGEGDGDGYALGNDKSILQAETLGAYQSYSNVIPRGVPDVQDLDADGYILGGDLSILKSFIIGALVGPINSRADSLQKVYEPAGSVMVGGTAHVTVRVRNLSATNNLYQAGFAVVFSIDPSSTGSAVLLGGDGSYGPGTRYDVSGPSGAADGGHATIFMKVTAPGTIIVNARIPACGAHGIGRWTDEIALDPAFTITTQ